MNNPLDPTLRERDDCGCCAGTTAATPVEMDNRPGLDSIAFRAGTQPQFKSTMLSALSWASNTALRQLQTRDDDDFTIALLDGWATVSDVLSFYSERIANEAFLRTATERRSVLELARSIGYELNPGVAASTLLAFTIDDAPGTPGHATIGAGARVQSIPGPGERPQTFETIETIDGRKEWNELRVKSTDFRTLTKETVQLHLRGTTTGLRKGDILVIVGDEPLEQNNWDLRRVKALELQENIDPSKAVTVVTLDRKLGAKNTAPSQLYPQVYALRQRGSLFGANAPDVKLLPPDLRAEFTDAATSTWKDFSIKKVSGEGEANGERTVHLDAVYPGIVVGSWIAIGSPAYAAELFKVTDVDEDAPTKFGLTNKVTRLRIKGQNLWEKFDDQLRQATVFLQSDWLPWALTPIVEPLSGGEIVFDSIVDPALLNGRKLIVQSTASDGTTLRETAVVRASGAAGVMHTKVMLAEPLVASHARASTLVFGNVAAATHGEAVSEVLGSGDGNQAHQRFTLKQAPLTYVRANNPSGGESTLQVWVDGVRWSEVPSLYDHGPREPIYVVRIGDDGKATVLFGDGRNGARLPTGSENVQAVYRKGSGRAGLLKEGQLSLLITRPLGVRGVANPMATEGGVDPQVLADARGNAPVTVLTLDRIVSLEDYEDFARSFTGIAKALASWTWYPNARGVLITVAEVGAPGAASTSTTREALKKALRDWGNPLVAVEVAAYTPVLFKLGGTVVVEPDRVPADVEAAVRQALITHFSFEKRHFGQPVTLSEVSAVIQRVPGVAFVDIDALYSGATSKREHYIGAKVPSSGAAANLAEPAELLTLDESSLGALVVKPMGSVS